MSMVICDLKFVQHSTCLSWIDSGDFTLFNSWFLLVYTGTFTWEREITSYMIAIGEQCVCLKWNRTRRASCWFIYVTEWFQSNNLRSCCREVFNNNGDYPFFFTTPHHFLVRTQWNLIVGSFLSVGLILKPSACWFSQTDEMGVVTKYVNTHTRL